MIIVFFILPFQGVMFYVFLFSQGVAPLGRCHWAGLLRAFSPKICKEYWQQKPSN